MRVLVLFTIALACMTACSSSSSDGSPTTGDGSVDGGADSSSDGTTGCVSPVEGAACTTSDVLCKGFEGGCCAGYVWQCIGGKWAKSGLGCPCMPTDTGADTTSTDATDAADATDATPTDAGPFACGATATCSSAELCREQASGIDGGTTSYSCTSIPSACASTPTCDCIKTKVPGCTGTCTTDASGHVTMHCMGA